MVFWRESPCWDLIEQFKMLQNTHWSSFEITWQFCLYCAVHIKDDKHKQFYTLTCLYTNCFRVCLNLLSCRLVDLLVDWWVDGRMTNWTYVCCGASEIYLPLHKMHDRHINYPFIWILHGTNRCLIYDYKFKSRVSFKKCCKREIKVYQ